MSGAGEEKLRRALRTLTLKYQPAAVVRTGPVELPAGHPPVRIVGARRDGRGRVPGTRLRVLLVAPSDSGLDAFSEFAAIQPYANITPLAGKITRRDVMQALAAGEFDVFHLIAHGVDDYGLNLGGEQVTGRQLARTLCRFELRLVLLMTCYSEQSAVDLVKAGLPAVVVVPGPITDTEAREFVGDLYRRLSQDGDIRGAFEWALTLCDEPAAPVLYGGGEI